jgi:pyruvate/2-oxoglutarate/acetoin dehydrogenase E1 component
MKVLAHADAMRATLIREMRADDKIILLSAGATELGQSLVREFGSDRIRGTALDSPAIAAAALGATQAGLRPVVELQSTAALSNLTALLQHIPPNASSIVFWLRPATEAIFADDGWLAGTAPAIVAFPASPEESCGCLATALQHKGGAVLLLDHPSLAAATQSQHAQPCDFAQATIKQAGTDLTLVTCGPAVAAGISAAELLQKNGHGSVEVVALGTLRPVDTKRVLLSLQKTGRVLFAAPRFVEAEVHCLVKAIHDNGFDDLDAPVRITEKLASADLVEALRALLAE